MMNYLNGLVVVVLVNISNSFNSCFSDSDSSINSQHEVQSLIRIIWLKTSRVSEAKKEVLQKVLYDNNIDDMIESETHLIDPPIKDS